MARLFLVKLMLFIGMLALGSSFGDSADRHGGVYGDDGKLIIFQYPDGKKEFYSYDDLGRMIRFVDKSGGMTNFAYNPDGSITTLLPDGRKLVSPAPKK